MARDPSRNFHPTNRMVHRVAACCLLLLGAALTLPAAATCYQVTGTVTSNPNPNQILTTEGKLVPSGQLSGPNLWGTSGLPGMITIINDTSLQPLGTTFASSNAPFTQWGHVGGYNPETVFFRCAPSDSIYEMYAMHGNDLLYNQQVSGLNQVYSTDWPDVGVRFTNNLTGTYFTNVWQQRPLTGLDVDSRGYVLVKAKNFTSVKTELVRINPANNTSTAMSYQYSSAGPYGADQWPLMYLVFSGPGAPSVPPVGSPAYGNVQGYYDAAWIGSLGFYNNISLRRQATCSVTNVTPVVTFSPITVNALNSGQSQSASFNLAFNCQTGAITSNTYADVYGSYKNGTNTYPCGAAYTYNSTGKNLCMTSSGTALGFLPLSANSIAQAQSLNLKTSAGGLTYLLSDRYGQPGIANGVGIRILRNGGPINLLINRNSALNSSKTSDTTANNLGWYKLVDVNTVPGSNGNYSESFQARLEKISGQTVTPGKVSATAQVVISVQ